MIFIIVNNIELINHKLEVEVKVKVELARDGAGFNWRAKIAQEILYSII